MKLTINGRPISKKNSKQIGKNKYSGAVFITASKQWKQFELDALRQLYGIKERFTGPIRVDYYFYFKGMMSTDIDNVMGGINDILQTAGIIDDDKNIKQGTFNIVGGLEEWSTDIEITKMI